MALSWRFLLLMGALLSAVATSATAGYRALNGVGSAFADVIQTDFQRLLALTHARRVLQTMSVLERDAILNPSSSAHAAVQMQVLASESAQHLQRYESLMLEEDRPRLHSIRQARQRWLARDSEILAVVNQDSDAARSLAIKQQGDLASWQTDIAELLTSNESRLAVGGDHAAEMTMRAQNTLTWISAISTLIALSLGTTIFVGIRQTLRLALRQNDVLEDQVRQRTATVLERERSLRLLLDSTGEGLILIDLAGRIEGECSEAARQWFGLPAPGVTIWSYLLPNDARACLRLELSITQLAEGLLPYELALDQLPRRLERGAHTFELDVKQVFHEGRFAKMLVIVRDISARIRAEESERAAREQQVIVGKLLADKTGFAQFVADMEQLLRTVTGTSDGGTLSRALHTIKGNAGAFGVGSVAELAHQLEDRIAEIGPRPSSGELEQLCAAWQRSLSSIEDFLHEAKAGVLEVKTEEHAALLQSIVARRDYVELLEMVETWTWEPTLEILLHLRHHAEELLRAIDKQAVVVVRDHGVRVPREYLRGFWAALIHVVRNAVDHGVDTESERRRLGKTERACIQLVTEYRSDELIIEVSDDGRGIDVDALSKRAGEMGLLSKTKDNAELLIFEEGLSTRREVSSVSGRGVGLSAVREACQAAGGIAEVSSVLGQGTTLRFRFRRPVVNSTAVMTNADKRWSLIRSAHAGV